ncbi:hypothetical protein JCM15519_21590 [Fundidesulfovibrio butyratiphilus]
MEGYPSHPAGMEPQHPTEVAYEAHILTNGDPVEGMAAAKLKAGQRPGGVTGRQSFHKQCGFTGFSQCIRHRAGPEQSSATRATTT